MLNRLRSFPRGMLQLAPPVRKWLLYLNLIPESPATQTQTDISDVRLLLALIDSSSNDGHKRELDYCKTDLTFVSSPRTHGGHAYEHTEIYRRGSA